MGKNNEVTTEVVKNEGTDKVTVEKKQDPTVAELMAKVEALTKMIDNLQTENSVSETKVNKPKTDPFKELVDYELPLTQYEHEDVSVCVNGRHYQIKRGYKVRVPKCIVNTIKESQEQDLETFNKIRALVEKSPV